jgi:hypothetical protein
LTRVLFIAAAVALCLPTGGRAAPLPADRLQYRSQAPANDLQERLRELRQRKQVQRQEFAGRQPDAGKAMEARKRALAEARRKMADDARKMKAESLREGRRMQQAAPRH